MFTNYQWKKFCEGMVEIKKFKALFLIQIGRSIFNIMKNSLLVNIESEKHFHGSIRCHMYVSIEKIEKF